MAKQLPEKEIIAWKRFLVRFIIKLLRLIFWKRKRKSLTPKPSAHPECRDEVLNYPILLVALRDAKFALEDDGEEYIVLTECGMIQRLMKESTHKNSIRFAAFVMT